MEKRSHEAKERKKEKKILCRDDDADGTWVYKNNNHFFFYGLSLFSLRAEASYIYFSSLLKLLYYFHSTSSHTMFCGFSSLGHFILSLFFCIRKTLFLSKDTNRENFLGHETVTFYIAIEEVEEIKNAAISAFWLGHRPSPFHSSAQFEEKFCLMLWNVLELLCYFFAIFSRFLFI